MLILLKQKESRMNILLFSTPGQKRDGLNLFYKGEKAALDDLWEKITEWIKNQEQ